MSSVSGKFRNRKLYRAKIYYLKTLNNVHKIYPGGGALDRTKVRGFIWILSCLEICPVCILYLPDKNFKKLSLAFLPVGCVWSFMLYHCLHSQSVLHPPASVPARRVRLQEQPLHPGTLEVWRRQRLLGQQRRGTGALPWVFSFVLTGFKKKKKKQNLYKPRSCEDHESYTYGCSIRAVDKITRGGS